MADEKPIGVFDSGLGGLTVARAIAERLPEESILYFGDSGRCPYGVKPQSTIRVFVAQIAEWFKRHDVKMVVIACNTATAAGVDLVQQLLSIPAIGVIHPGALAVVHATRTRHVGVLATEGTCSSGEYVRAIKAIDKGVQVWQAPSSRAVEIVEHTLAAPAAMGHDWKTDLEIFDTPENNEVAVEDSKPLLGHDIDAVILGCTHYPLLKPEFQKALGDHVTIVSSAEETALEVEDYLRRGGDFAPKGSKPMYRFATTSDDITSFAVAGEFVFGRPLESVERVEIPDLEALTPAVIPAKDDDKIKYE